MKRKTWIWITRMVVFAVLAGSIRLGAQEEPAEEKQSQQNQLPFYVVIDLGTLGGTSSVSAGINNKRWVTGYAALSGNTAVHAFLRQDRRKTDLGTLSGPNSQVFRGPNEMGMVAGLAETSAPDPLGEDFCFFGTHLTCLPFLWQNGAMTALPTLGGNNGVAFGINNRGQVGGLAENSTSDPTCSAPALQSEPVIWENGKIRQLPTFSGDPDGYVGGINDKGQAVGGSGNCAAGFGTLPLHVLLWQDDTVTDLGNLGGTLFSGAQDINNSGQVIGNSDLPGDTNFLAGAFSNAHGFLWQDGVISDLGTLLGDVQSFTNGINNRGQVVGVSLPGNGQSRAFLWQKGTMTDLNTLVPGGPFAPLYLVEADGINARGEIAGIGLAISGERHAYLAIPCDDDHADVQECKDDVRNTTAETATEPAPSMGSAQRVTRDTRARGGVFGGIQDRPYYQPFPSRHFSTPQVEPRH